MDMDFLEMEAMMDQGFSEEMAEEATLFSNDDIPLEDMVDYDMF